MELGRMEQDKESDSRGEKSKKPSPQVKEPSSQVEEPSSQVKEPSPQVKEPSPQGKKPNPQVKEPIHKVKEPTPEVKKPIPPADIQITVAKTQRKVEANNNVQPPPCAKSILETLSPGKKGKIQITKDAAAPVNKFASVCMTDDGSLEYYLVKMQEEAQSYLEMGKICQSPGLKSWVVAYSPEDVMFYRAVIIAVEANNTFTALLVDFGTTQKFSKSHLIDIWTAAAEGKALAIHLSTRRDISAAEEKRLKDLFDSDPTVDGEVVSRAGDEAVVRFRGVEYTARA